MKKDFQLERANVVTGKVDLDGKISIIGQEPQHKPYVSIDLYHEQLRFIQDKDLERFAVNILKALKSKHYKK